MLPKYDLMNHHEYALHVRRETLARSLAEEKKRRPLGPDARRIQADLDSVDRDLDKIEKEQKAS